MIERQEFPLGDGSSMYDKNGQFVVISPDDFYDYGKIVSVMKDDDMSHNPKFQTVDRSRIKSDKDCETAYIHWSHLKAHHHFSSNPKPLVDAGQEPKVKDEGEHYRFCLEVAVTEEDAAKGSVQIKLDPFRVAEIYGMDDFAMQTMLKKILVAGERGHKDLQQDLKDIICAAERKLEMLNEDDRLFV